jgi:allantoate deiminase
VSGSHIDSQKPGGRYDGALGVIAACIAIRTLKESFGTPIRPIEVVSFCEEESSRFRAANFWGSRAVTGQIGPSEVDTIKDSEGVSIGEAMRAVGLEPNELSSAVREDIDTFIELHIEQGPTLEELGLPVGIVNAITGPRHYLVTLVGRADHAGARPMNSRLDPMAGAAEIISGAIQTALEMGPPAVTTVGQVVVEPNLPAVIPAKVTFSIDARHPDPLLRTELYSRLESLTESIAARRSLEMTRSISVDAPPSLSDPGLVQLLQRTAMQLGLQAHIMHSGAGHDSQQMATRCKTAMIFVRSKDGRSHTPDEFTSPADAAAGITLLTRALFQLAYA